MILAHLSDLHLGKSDNHRRAGFALRDSLLANKVDHAIVTGDITENGRVSEYAIFKSIFSSLLETNKMVIVPGNHDRLNDEVAKGMLDDRVSLVSFPGLRLILVDSTGPHNRWRYAGHGKLDEYTILKILDFVKYASALDFVAVAMHHHLLPLPEDLLLEKISDFFRLPFAAELKLGRQLLDSLRGCCDAVFHGHRHASTEKEIHDGNRPLNLYNAGSSTQLAGFRIFEIEDGKLKRPPTWVEAAVVS